MCLVYTAIDDASFAGRMLESPLRIFVQHVLEGGDIAIARAHLLLAMFPERVHLERGVRYLDIFGSDIEAVKCLAGPYGFSTCATCTECNTIQTREFLTVVVSELAQGLDVMLAGFFNIGVPCQECRSPSTQSTFLFTNPFMIVDMTTKCVSLELIPQEMQLAAARFSLAGIALHRPGHYYAYIRHGANFYVYDDLQTQIGTSVSLAGRQVVSFLIYKIL